MWWQIAALVGGGLVVSTAAALLIGALLRRVNARYPTATRRARQRQAVGGTETSRTEVDGDDLHPR